MLQFNPKKRPTASQLLRHPYFAKFYSAKEEKVVGKTIYPPVSDNKKLNMKQYRQLIYDRIRKVYRNHEEEVSRPSSLHSASRLQGGDNRFSSKDEHRTAD